MATHPFEYAPAFIAHPHDILRGWGLKLRASLLRDSDRPLGLRELAAHAAVAAALIERDCFEEGARRLGILTYPSRTLRPAALPL